MVNKSKSSSKSSNNNITIHTILPRETKFGIAKQYEITITELEYLNPTMGESLNVGDIINVPKSIVLAESIVVDEDEFELYEVLPKEGFFNLAIFFFLIVILLVICIIFHNYKSYENDSKENNQKFLKGHYFP